MLEENKYNTHEGNNNIKQENSNNLTLDGKENISMEENFNNTSYVS